MNRNQLYNYLVDLGLKRLIKHHYGKKFNGHYAYHTEFVPDMNTSMRIESIITDWGYIRGVNRIYICRNEIVLASDYDSCKINMNYKDIKKFEVRMYDENEEYIL